MRTEEIGQEIATNAGSVFDRLIFASIDGSIEQDRFRKLLQFFVRPSLRPRTGEPNVGTTGQLLQERTQMSVARFGGRGEVIMSSTDGLRILFERLIQQAPAIRDGDAQAIAWLTRDLHNRARQEPVDELLSELIGMVGERAQSMRVKPTSETTA